LVDPLSYDLLWVDNNDNDDDDDNDGDGGGRRCLISIEVPMTPPKIPLLERDVVPALSSFSVTMSVSLVYFQQYRLSRCR